MKYYTATRTLLASPVYKYFDSIDELNSYWGIDSKIEDYNCGYSFQYADYIYMTLGYDEE